MKYLLIFGILILLGAGCSFQGNVNGENVEYGDQTAFDEQAKAEVQETWEAVLSAAADEECATFNSYLAEDIQQSAEDCEVIFAAFDAGVPAINWDLTTADAGEVTIYMEGERIMTTFNKVDGEWISMYEFWPEQLPVEEE